MNMIIAAFILAVGYMFQPIAYDISKDAYQNYLQEQGIQQTVEDMCYVQEMENRTDTKDQEQLFIDLAKAGRMEDANKIRQIIDERIAHWSCNNMFEESGMTREEFAEGLRFQCRTDAHSDSYCINE